ncbi:MAG: redox-regulated ATPase YchF [Methanosphaera sp.]|uniref:redox-regulated ATPase YchF n=1 Tax=Methanosphaera sp. TaxID=2666342 RepID=UPI0025EAFDFB|nr:redox-regulated ATPase YchF [Methanosphaera sp.]MCI5866874.1 redox-regulated ATPase YchF [Methanosphaera sp.]MDD6534381.1 redox-regulated ATPase YchF [Methanosphaera sp.]MDY3955214.1 redox-regulated ATPase YchF [Methanosphaera sp.]
MLQIAVTGKPNVGKSSFFNSATLSEAEVANYPFTTIDANAAIAYVTAQCPCGELDVTCNPRTGKCEDSTRYIPVELIDVAGLVPGAHEGKGLGNQFLDDLSQARALIHIIDASGSTDEEGNPCDPGSHDPLDDVNFLRDEVTMWLYSILERNWSRLIRKVMSEHLNFAKVIADQLSGAGVFLDDVLEAERIMDDNYDKWEKEDILKFLSKLLEYAKPIIIVANKIDTPQAEENIARLKEHYEVIPTSAESELALINAAKAGLISYKSGDDHFDVIDDSKLSEKQKAALDYIDVNVLKKYGSTGVQNVINTAVYDVLNQIVVYPVEDEHKYSDQKGNILPDALLIPKGSNPRDLAYCIHTDIGEGFTHAIDARRNMRISSEHELEQSDIISIISNK